MCQLSASFSFKHITCSPPGRNKACAWPHLQLFVKRIRAAILGLPRRSSLRADEILIPQHSAQCAHHECLHTHTDKHTALCHPRAATLSSYRHTSVLVSAVPSCSGPLECVHSPDPGIVTLLLIDRLSHHRRFFVTLSLVCCQ